VSGVHCSQCVSPLLMASPGLSSLQCQWLQSLPGRQRVLPGERQGPSFAVVTAKRRPSLWLPSQQRGPFLCCRHQSPWIHPSIRLLSRPLLFLPEVPFLLPPVLLLVGARSEGTEMQEPIAVPFLTLSTLSQNSGTLPCDSLQTASGRAACSLLSAFASPSSSKNNRAGPVPGFCYPSTGEGLFCGVCRIFSSTLKRLALQAEL